MKLRTTVGKLLGAFAITSPTLDNKGVTANLYLNANEKSKSLYLYSTNLLSETATRMLVDEIDIPGEVLVNPGKIKDGLQGLPKDTPVVLNLVDNNLKVSASNVKLSLATSTGTKEMGDRMRSIPRASTKVNSTMPVVELAEFASRSEFCLPNDETGQRASLSVLKLTTEEEREEAFATDGSIAVHVASVQKQDKGEGLAEDLLIPTDALQALKTILTARKKGETVDIIVTKNKVYFRCADGTHLGILIPVIKYPNIREIINQKTLFSFDVPKESFKQTLNRANAVLSWSSNKTLELEFSEDNLSIKANGTDNLTDSITITYKKDKPAKAVTVGMNTNYLLNIVNHSNSENLTISFSTEDTPLVITDQIGDDVDEQINVKYVVMGVKLNGKAKQ